MWWRERVNLSPAGVVGEGVAVVMRTAALPLSPVSETTPVVVLWGERACREEDDLSPCPPSPYLLPGFLLLPLSPSPSLNHTHTHSHTLSLSLSSSLSPVLKVCVCRLTLSSVLSVSSQDKTPQSWQPRGIYYVGHTSFPVCPVCVTCSAGLSSATTASLDTSPVTECVPSLSPPPPPSS